MRKYYEHVDNGDIGAAIAMLDEDVEFTMVLPSGENRGFGRDAMRAYLEGRPPVNRKHLVLRAATDRDLEFAHGKVTEHCAEVTGDFVGVMHVNRRGLIDRYQVTFSSDFAVIPAELAQWPSGDVRRE